MSHTVFQTSCTSYIFCHKTDLTECVCEIYDQTNTQRNLYFVLLAHSGRCEFNVLVQEHQPEFWRRPTFVNAALKTQQINCPLHLWQSLLLQYYCLSHEAKPPGLGTELKGCGSLLATFKDALFLITRLVC